jgi:hypothetical protein
VMTRLGMTRGWSKSPASSRVEPGHPLRRHVLYRLPQHAWQRLATPAA